MSISGGVNIGQATVKVVLLNKSPFSGQQKQEVAHYFTQDNFNGMAERDNIAPVPSPINGYRNKDFYQGYDNFIVDIEGNRLEESFYEQTIDVINPSGETESVTSPIRSDSSAAARYEEFFRTAEDGAEQARRVQEVTDEQRDFFTWQVTQSIFLKSEDNPPPPKFTEAPGLDNTPEWTYVALPRPGSDIKSVMLTPFMKKNPPNSASPVHWGCVLGGAAGGIAFNQGFEIAYYYCLRDPSIAQDAEPQVSRYKFVTTDGSEITGLDLTGSVYVAIEFGMGSPKDNYLLLCRNGSEPFLFQLTGQGQAREAVLLARFDGFNAEKMFDPNHKFFTLSVEPVAGSFIIRSNVFSQTPWIISTPPTNPIFVGEGPIAVYSGNVQAGITMRPLQYVHEGSFKTPKMTFTLAGGGGEENLPFCSTALKGAGEVEQSRSYGDDGPSVHMVDSEKVNGQGVITFLQFASNRKTTQGGERNIQVSIEDVTENKGNSSDNLGITSRDYQTKIVMISGDVSQPSGFVVKDGKSPYIFMTRCELPSANPEGDAGEGEDISCDVMSVDLNWNATSYNEIRHTGTIRILNIRNVSGTDYRKYTNRSIYLRIYAGWKDGAGIQAINPIFTGQTIKADVETRAEREVVTFQVEDYMAALDGNKFILSPFYDGMKASLAVRDMVLGTGFPDSKILTGNTHISSANLSNDFGLPLANPLEGDTKFRFKDGSSIKDGIMRIAKLDFKVIYFDGKGNFHYDNMPGGIFNNKNFTVMADYWSSAVSSQSAPGVNQVWNSVTFSRMLNDVYNVIQVFSVDKRLLARLTAATLYKAGIYDPKAEGYLGYRKHFIMSEPALGSIDALMRYLDNYRRRMMIPPLSARFEAYGRSDIKPLDMITLDGQLLRVMNIQTHINKSENIYYHNIEGEWMFAAGSGKDQAPQLSSPNSGAQTSSNGAGSRSTH